MTLRVVHVASGREWRGGQRQVWLLARELSRMGAVEQLVVTGAGTELAQRLTEDRVAVHTVRWRMGLDPRVVPAVIAQIRRGGSLLHAHDAHAVTLTDLSSRLSSKGYHIVQDPNAAQYVVLTNIVYCNLTKPELPVEDMVSIMSGLHGLAGMASMAGPQGAIAGSAATMGLGAISSVGSAVGNMFGGPSRPSDCPSA